MISYMISSSGAKMLPVIQSKTGTRDESGKLDILIIAIVCLVLVAALIFVAFNIIGHSEEHVEKVRKTKIKYRESLRWRADSKLAESRIRKDLNITPNSKSVKYTDLDVDENCLKLIGRMSGVQELKLTRSTVQDPWLAHLAKLPLRSFNLHGCPVTDEAIPYILEFKHLNQLSIGDTELTDKGLEELSSSKSITGLELNMGRCLTNDGIKHLAKMTQLTQLDLSSSKNLTGECLANLKDIKGLFHLTLEDIPIEAKDLVPITSLKHLGVLDLTNCRLTDQALFEVSKVKSLFNLDLTGSNFTDKGVKSLAKLINLRHLTIKECPNVDDEAITYIKAALPNCRVKYSRSGSLSEKLSREDIKQQVQFLESEVRSELEKSKNRK